MNKETDPHRDPYNNNLDYDPAAERDYLTAVHYHGPESVEAQIAGALADAAAKPSRQY